jgi:Spy/CpxP family protein refolding chaperone
MTKYILLIASCVIFSFSSFAGGAKHPKRGEWLKKELNLTEQQQNQIKTIMMTHHKNIKELRSKSDQAKEDLGKSMSVDNKSPEYKAELTNKFETYRTLKTEFQRARFMKALEIREILNPEQLAKFNALEKRRRKHK